MLGRRRKQRHDEELTALHLDTLTTELDGNAGGLPARARRLRGGQGDAVARRDGRRRHGRDPHPGRRPFRRGLRAWYASGPLYAAWAGGWYAELVEEGRIEAERLTMAYAGVVQGTAGAAATDSARPAAVADSAHVRGKTATS